MIFNEFYGSKCERSSVDGKKVFSLKGQCFLVEEADLIWTLKMHELRGIKISGTEQKFLWGSQ
jgi:hypothetical protein